MENYKNKYLKYKSKYQELKKKLGQKGGDVNEFYLYTTGIAYTIDDTGDNTRDGDPLLINYWNSVLRKIIIDKIPEYINRIHISHHDILVNEISGTYPIDPEPIVKRFNEMLQREDIGSNERIATSSFTNQPLNLDEVRTRSHLVLDFAHIFRYDKNIPRVIYNVNEEVPNPYPISAIYLGFIGEEFIDNGYSNRNIIDIPLFTVNVTETGENQTTTYIDRFIDLRYDYNVYEPNLFFFNKIKQFKTSLYPDWRAKYGNLSAFDDIFNNQTVVKQIFDYLVELIYERGVVEEQLIPELRARFLSLMD